MIPPPAANPSGRTLAAWWRQLGPHKPCRLWLADWLIHRLDVLVESSRTATLEPLPRLLLDALRHSHTPSPTSVAIRLGVEPALAAALLNELAAAGLVQSAFATSWAITEAGRAALTRGQFTHSTFHRRTFTFRHDSPAFLPLTGPGQPVSLIDPPPAPLEALRACVGREREWKRCVGFPEEIVAIHDLNSPTPEWLPAWKSVPVDRPERLTAALISTDDQMLGFAIKPDGVTLGAGPILTLSTEGATELGLPEPALDSWRAGWRDWSKGIVGEEAVGMERAGHQVIVKVTASVVERLRAAHPEVFRGEKWLFAGDAKCREAAELVVRT
jgi:hypothetical protein